MTKIYEEYSQMSLVHVNGGSELSADGSDQNLIDFILHNKVREPPALHSLYALPLAMPRKTLLCHA